ncbi:MAG TPA: ATP-binding protein, partial [Gemmatimonadota bacterium]|nr:ATP-binding protein [Gemmatimonadota bacterium]
AALSGDRTRLAAALAGLLAAAGWLALAAGRRSGEMPSTPRTAIAAVALACLATLPLAAWARAQAAHELLVERSLRIGEASSQWLDYTMGRTVEFLSTEPQVVSAIADRNRDAALGLWSRSPLSELDFATGLYLFDVEEQVVSEFSLSAEDLVDRARRYLGAVDPAQVAVRGSEGTLAIRWAVVPVVDGEERIGTVVALTTGALEFREQAPGAAFLLTNLMAGAGPGPDLPGFTTLGPREAPPPRTLLTRVETEAEGAAGVRLAMPLEPLLPGARALAVFMLVGAIGGLVIGTVERAADPRQREIWRDRLAEGNPLRSFRVQLLVAFLALAAVPLGLYAILGFRATRAELEDATRTAAAEALSAASRLLAEGDAIEVGTSRSLSIRLREISGVLQQDFILYWRGRTVASSRPEIFASRLFADRMEGGVYADLFAVRRPLVFDETAFGNRSFLVAYRRLADPQMASGYVLATPLLIREDRVRVDLQRLGEGVFLLSAFSIGFLLVVGWGIARYMSRPLSELERGTQQIAAGRLSYRLPTPAREDEFGRLQRAFNAMAGRLDASQRALEREKSRVQAILSSVGAGVVALDGGGRVRLINDRAAALLGLDADEVLGRRPAELTDRRTGLTRRFWEALDAELAGHRRSDRELVALVGDGERHYHLVTTGLRAGEEGERGLVVAFEDITENVQSQRVLAWGEMARQVAHEIKNPLTPMKLSLQHLERVIEDGGPDFERVFRENLDLVLAEIERLERIAGSFARFAVPQPAETEPFDAVAVARDVVDLYATGGDTVRYRLEIEGEPRPLLGEAEGFRRVLVNLLQNAREAVLAKPEEGGEVEVRLDWTVGEGGARVSVLDDGVGLPEDEAERLFEPSFSTKTRGTGLGLAITRRIVEAWGGAIEWERRPGGGTAIHVRLRTAGA